MRIKIGITEVRLEILVTQVVVVVDVDADGNCEVLLFVGLLPRFSQFFHSIYSKCAASIVA